MMREIKGLRLVSVVLFLLGCGMQLSAFEIKGKLVDSASEPEAYATVRIYNAADTVKAAALGVSSDDGRFSLEVPDKGKYVVAISSVGKKKVEREVSLDSSVADLGTIVMVDNAEELGEVEVTARRPLVKKEIDRIGYDVQADEDSRTATVNEILRKVPMVTVDDDGTIKVRGTTNFKIYKNGRPNNAFTNNAKDLFKAIPAAMIKKIEVITDPGAREDAEGVGAILNIETMDNTSVDGVMGNVNLTYTTKSDWPMVNGFITGSLGKFALSAHGGYTSQSRAQSRHSNRSVKEYVNTGNKQVDESSGDTYGNVGFWGLDSSFELDSLNLFTMEFGGFSYGVKAGQQSGITMLDPSGEIVSRFDAKTYIPKTTYLDFNGNFNYQRLTRLKDESITLSYQISNNTNNMEQLTEYEYSIGQPAPYSAIGMDQRQRFLEQTVQLDWTRPFAKHSKFSLGGKFIHRKNHSIADNTYILNAGDQVYHTDFNHLTTIAAGYFDYRLNVGKWSARTGLRYEFSRLKADFRDGSQNDFASNLNDWVPNASVMYEINDENSLKAAFSTRIHRPGINYLNPNVEMTPLSQSFGNPDLESIHFRTISLNYSLTRQKINLDATIGYDFANNTITSVTTVDDKDFTTTTYGNVGRNRKLNFDLFLQWNATKKTSFTLNMSGGYNKIAIPEVENSRWFIDSFFRMSQQLPWKLRLEAFIFYRHGELSNVYGYEEGVLRSVMHGFSLQRSFLKEGRLTVRVQAMNPFAFNGNQWASVTDRGGYTGRNVSSMESSRRVSFSIGYRFGSVKKGVKKTATGISNDDLQGGATKPSTSM